MNATINTEWLNINDLRIQRQLFDRFGNRYNELIVEEYQRNSKREWVKVNHNNSSLFYLVGNQLYMRSGDGLMFCETDFDNEQLNVCWKVVETVTDFTRITGNTILFENKYRRLHRQDYSDGACFYSLYEWLERPYPHYARDFRVDEGADNLQELIYYMNGQLEFDYAHLKKSYVQNNPIIKERVEQTIAEEQELIEFMKQYTKQVA